MREKPVIILGGGALSGLLALRLREQRPDLRVELFDDTGHLGGTSSHSFPRGDLTEDQYLRLRPLIAQEWESYGVEFFRSSHSLREAYCFLTPDSLRAQLEARLDPKDVHLGASLTTEEALRRGSFVIDARDVKSGGASEEHRKSLGLELRVRPHSGFTEPLVFDGRIEQKGGFRYLRILPLGTDRILVRDVRFSRDRGLRNIFFDEDLLRDCVLRGFEIHEVLRREEEYRWIPKIETVLEGPQRLIRLQGLIHDLTEDSLPESLRLIDRMVKTSFRYGELRESLRNYQAEGEKRKRLQRLSAGPSERYSFIEGLYDLPSRIRRRVFAGELGLKDIALGALESPRISMLGFIPQVILKNSGTLIPALPSRN